MSIYMYIYTLMNNYYTYIFFHAIILFIWTNIKGVFFYFYYLHACC